MRLINSSFTLPWRPSTQLRQLRHRRQATRVNPSQGGPARHNEAHNIMLGRNLTTTTTKSSMCKTPTTKQTATTNSIIFFIILTHFFNRSSNTSSTTNRNNNNCHSTCRLFPVWVFRSDLKVLLRLRSSDEVASNEWDAMTAWDGRLERRTTTPTSRPPSSVRTRRPLQTKRPQDVPTTKIREPGLEDSVRAIRTAPAVSTAGLERKSSSYQAIVAISAIKVNPNLKIKKEKKHLQWWKIAALPSSFKIYYQWWSLFLLLTFLFQSLLFFWNILFSNTRLLFWVAG